jgi:hypothetical protein
MQYWPVVETLLEPAKGKREHGWRIGWTQVRVVQSSAWSQRAGIIAEDAALEMEGIWDG